MPTDITEKGLESLIVASLTGRDQLPPTAPGMPIAPLLPFGTDFYTAGRPEDYDRDHAVDLPKLLEFLAATQPKALEAMGITGEGPARVRFLDRLQGEITRRGIIDVLRKGIKDGPHSVELYYKYPTPGNPEAARLFASNIFSVTRQLHYSRDETRLALDLVLFINGLPVATFELKNQLTKQTVEDAIEQYKRDRDPRELLFQPGRCIVHFALDDYQAWMCTELKGKASWFLPFNKGYNDGAGNPPNPNGLVTDYLWKDILARSSLANIIENYAQVVEEEDGSGRKRKKQIFPRYHQLDSVRNLLDSAQHDGTGRRYLVQHSAGSGKSNSIAWLAHQLVDLKRDGAAVFDSIIVVTDRRVLDRQIRETVRQFAQVSAVVGAALHSGDLKRFIEGGKKIIITTVQKFPHVLEEIGDAHRGRKFALIIDEAHSSQGGRVMGKMHVVLSEQGSEEDESYEDLINRIIESHRLLPNASYFAFTATPKNKTLEMFGSRWEDGSFHPFHSYTMKQAIQEGFILDVLRSYTPVGSYYRLIKTVKSDPEFDVKKAQKKLRRYVEGHDHAIRRKAEIMVDHFHEEVFSRGKLGGRARAMVVTSGIQRAMQYFSAFNAYLEESKSPHKAIVAFSGEHEFEGRKNVSEATLNGFPSHEIPIKFREDPYRFLIVADKFQTGYDEPLLHSMYVDKTLSGGKAVQTLSRLNRAHPHKYDTFVLDFANDADTIQMAFEPYYRTTILGESTDPNKLHNLKGELDGFQVYAWEQVEKLTKLFLQDEPRERLDPIADVCVPIYTNLGTDNMIAFKGKAKVFVRTYNFLATILPFAVPEWEKLAIFLNFLIPKLPSPPDDDLSKGILETIDMESYRTEMKKAVPIILPDQDGKVGPIPVGGPHGKPEPELDRLSAILQQFNSLFGNIAWKDEDKIREIITEEIPARVAADRAYQNARKNSDKQNARLEHDKALARVILELLSDQTELFKQFSDNVEFKKWLSETVFSMTYPGT